MDTLVDTGEDISQISIVQVGDLVEIPRFMLWISVGDALP